MHIGARKKGNPLRNNDPPRSYDVEGFIIFLSNDPEPSHSERGCEQPVLENHSGCQN